MNNTIYPCLWFNGNAKEAADFYCTVFHDTSITAENDIVVELLSSGQKFICLNGRADFPTNPSLSFYVLFETMEEINKAWNLLIEGGKVFMPFDKYDWSEKYGWVQDRFGVSWQLSYGRFDDIGQKFTPTFMFTGAQQGNAEKAINYYTSIFKDSSVIGILRYNAGEDVEGTIKHAQFKLHGQVFMAMDSSQPDGFAFNEGISMVVNCKDQEEIDHFWKALTYGGSEGQCGWLKDQFGVSWQIVPSVLGQLMSQPASSGNVVKAFMKMKKFNIKELEEAAIS
jgi:predicted 3-demethylubiquinone-9 3-methyltransferase (glyoxalase superfamily)